MAEDFLTAVQSRVARVAVSPSAVRRQGPGATVAARRFLAGLDLTLFTAPNPVLFREVLDQQTEGLIKALPAVSRSFGLSRKLLNIFLRDSLYTFYLRQEYELEKTEDFFEIPLDSITAGHIWREATDESRPPRWETVRRLTPEASDAYQSSAADIAVTQGIARVHLDTFWWGEFATSPWTDEALRARHLSQAALSA